MVITAPVRTRKEEKDSLLWELLLARGQITRAAYAEAAGLKPAQASLLLNDWFRRHEHLLEREGHKVLLRSTPGAAGTHANEFLQALLSATIAGDTSRMIIGTELGAKVHLGIQPHVPDEIFWPVMRAIQQRKPLTVTYVALEDPRQVPTPRDVLPVRLAFWRDRWTVVCFCFHRNSWREFSLSRILKTDQPRRRRPVQQVPVESLDDTILIFLTPSPDLNEHQQAILRREYAMTHGYRMQRVTRDEYFYLQQTLIAKPHESSRLKPLIEWRPEPNDPKLSAEDRATLLASR